MGQTRAQATLIVIGAALPLCSALAADLPVKAGLPAPAVIDWSGVYVGLHAGYGGGMNDWLGSFPPFNYATGGALAGAQIGINKQIASFVFGLELDGSWANISGSETNSPYTASAFTLVGTGRSRIEALATAAGRLGLAADHWLVYAKGGFAGAWERHAFTAAGDLGFGPVGASTSAGEYRWGTMAGFGAEFAPTGNWSLKADYDYLRFGTASPTLSGTSTSLNITVPTSFPQPITQDAIHLVKVGANYRMFAPAIDPKYPAVNAASGTNWTGAYVGVEGGYGFGRNDWPDQTTPDVTGSGSYDLRGWLGGLDGGANIQSGIVVLGVEGELMWTGIKGSQTFAFPILHGTATTSLNSRIDWLALATGRAGFAISDHLLVYGKGGLAVASETGRQLNRGIWRADHRYRCAFR
ncbi:outer membrane protein [Bradyrhizobium vignae]|uniref:Outer membrane protein beta-barrel domain-containing protein n=1 Tax=Bradyrhizobium vignae TaxID=1549949 RepID=A0A2U3Q6W7_9BRAD|nr:outer membrane beta-barrel protein [Bradyrhizobium vignae]SPP97086.1 exported protein of unknown function [Bradyrhizobium vignae]